jgi:hypothetical protein
MATTLNGTTLVDPYEVITTREMIGGVKEAANGTKLIDYASSTLKKRVSMRWRLLTVTERNTIITQIQNAITASRTLILPNGESITVWFNPEQQPTETIINRGVAGYFYNLEAAFMEA